MNPTLKIFRLPRHHDVEIWEARNMLQGTTFLHDTYTVCSLAKIERRGGARWRYRGRDLVSSEKSLMLMEPGEVHATQRTIGRADYFVLRFPPHLMESIAKESGLQGIPRLKKMAVEDGTMLTAFLSFHELVNTRGSSVLQLDFHLSRCIYEVLQRCCEQALPDRAPGGNRRALLAARDYIHAHESEEVSLESLTSISGLSRFHFLREFRREFGLPPHAYQLHARVTRGAELIRRGQIVPHAQLGFSDQSHFIRHFKRVVGVTPGRYAAMVRQPVAMG